MPRILFAGLFHETHTFVEEITQANQFQWLRGEAMLACAGEGSPLGSALAAAQQLGWEIIPTLDCRAQPSGTAADEVFETFWRELRPQIEQALQQGIDAIFLILHGAMATPSFRDVEGELLTRLRSLPGLEQLPIYGVFDLHANFSPVMARLADCLVAYRENPHADAAQAALRGVELLHTTLNSGRKTQTVWRHSGIVWPPTGTGTNDSPMLELEALARKIERENPEVLAVNVVGGFAFADTPDTGASFSIITQGNPAVAETRLDELCNLAWELRERGNRVDPPLDQVMEQLCSQPLPGLTVVVEPADNIGGGAPGDGTGLLRAFLAHNLSNAAICICDPESVAATQSLALGERITLAIGGKCSRLDAGPISLEVELLARTDGEFVLEDPRSHLASICGDRFCMGSCAVVRHSGLTLLLTSIKTPPFDLGQWRSQGISPEHLSVIGVKAAVAHRRAYDPIVARMLWVDTPGPCSSNVRSFPYQHIRPPIYPLAPP